MIRSSTIAACLSSTITAMAVCSAADATNWTLTFTSVSPNQIVKVNFDASRTFNAAAANSFSSTYAGRMIWTGPGGVPTSTYCTEIVQHISSNQTVTFAETAVENVPNGSPGPVGAIKAILLRDLYARNYATVLASSSGKVNAAFQDAIWEITHENITAADATGALAQLQMGQGAMQLKVNNAGGSVYQLATAMLAGLGAGGTFFDFDGLAGLTHETAQDQLVVVPIPVPALLAGFGLIALGVVRRRHSN